MTTITLLPGHTAVNVRDLMREQVAKVQTLRGSGGVAVDRYNNYLRWADEAVTSLSFYLRPSSVEWLVMSQRYWLLQGLERLGPMLDSVINLETHQAVRRFEEAFRQLDGQVIWGSQRLGQVFVADTNVYVHHPQLFDEIDWAAELGVEHPHLVMPETVLNELDRLKRSGKDHTRTRARMTLKRVEHWLSNPRHVASIPLANGAFTFEVMVDDPGHVRLANADRELIDRTADLVGRLERPPIFVTYDTAALFVARGSDLASMRPLQDELV